MKKYIVTGGAGFVGSHIVDALIKRGDKVHIIDNLSSGTKENINPKAVFHHLDIRELKKIQPIFKNIDGVFHLAALPRVQYSIDHPVETMEVNITGTLNVILAAKQAGVKRIVYSASSSAYGDPIDLPQVESMLPKPKSPYGLQKYVGEHLMRLWSEIYGIETVSLRYFNIFGPRQDSEGAYAQVIARFLKQKKDGKKMTIAGDGSQTRDFIHVRDVVHANLLAMESEKVGKGEVINIGSAKHVSVLEIAMLIDGKYEFLPPRIEPHDTLADITVAKKLLNWRPMENFAKGVEELKGK
jgi:nucleoside-diphosphate-sugar epimerase